MKKYLKSLGWMIFTMTIGVIVLAIINIEWSAESYFVGIMAGMVYIETLNYYRQNEEA